MDSLENFLNKLNSFYLKIKFTPEYSKAKIICSDNEIFHKPCSDLGWLIKRGYNEKMIRKQILIAREHSRNNLLEREKKKKLPS